MRNTLAIARKELNIYFTTPMAYVMFCGTTVISSYFFIAFLQRYTQLSLFAMQAPQAVDPTKLNLTDLVMSPLVGNIGIILVFFVPFLTMRLLAEEKRQHTMELLMTAPVRPTEIVLGKFIAGFTIVAITIAFTLIYPAVLHIYGGSAGKEAPVEWSTVGAAYLGLMCWGATTISVGLFISSLTENQAVAALITIVFLLLTWVVGAVGDGAGAAAKEILSSLSAITHLRNLTTGEIAVKDLVYFLSLTTLGLFLCQRTVESQRWE